MTAEDNKDDKAQSADSTPVAMASIIPDGSTPSPDSLGSAQELGTITAIVYREEEGQSLGVSVGKKKGRAVVSKLLDAGLFGQQQTPLQVGMEVLAINGTRIDAKSMTIQQIGSLLTEVKVGAIVIDARHPVSDEALKEQAIPAATNSNGTITAVIQKGVGEKLGLSVGRKGNRPHAITKLVDGGLAQQQTNLKVSMEVLSINGNIVTNWTTAATVGDLLKSGSTITIVVKKPMLAPGTLITAVLTKTDGLNQPVGIGLKNAAGGGGVAINSIKAGSLAEATELQPGMVIQTVNNIDCTKKSPNDVLALLKSSSNLVILAKVPTTTTTTCPAGERPPPKGLPSGGEWSKDTFAGNTTFIWCVLGCICFGVFGPLALCCPCDERDIYTVNGKVYSHTGQFIRTEKKTNNNVRVS